MNYVALPKQVKATQFVDINQELPEWLTDWEIVERKEDSIDIKLKEQDVYHNLVLGDWIIQDDSGDFFYDDNIFKQNYTDAYQRVFEMLREQFEAQTNRRKPYKVPWEEWKQLKKVTKLLQKI